MNKIIVDEEVTKKLDNNISTHEVMTVVPKLTIDIKGNTDLEVIINTSKLDIEFNIIDNISTNIGILVTNGEKIRYTYNLSKNSKVLLNKFNNTSMTKEDININLDGEYASIDYIFKTISETSENYDYLINHKALHTRSNIINNGVNIKDGNLIFKVTSIIPNGIKDCYANQTNRIVNLTNNKCMIYPNLLIDEDDVVANHSAYLGRFRDEEIFYLESRGIDYDTATCLLIKGFLNNNIDNKMISDKINEYIDKYW